MSDDRNVLLDAVDALTLDVRSKVLQEVDGRMVTATVTLPPLLNQLEEAIRGTIGKGGSGALAHQRNMLDADALFRFTKISSTIKDWARMAGATITHDDPAKTLRGWYTAYQVTKVTVDAERFYGRQMEGWAKQIADKLNPPRIWDLPNPCPVCGASTWWSKSTHEEYARPLIVEYHETGANLIQDAKAMCRACEQVWSVRELAYAIETSEGDHYGNVEDTA